MTETGLWPGTAPGTCCRARTTVASRGPWGCTPIFELLLRLRASRHMISSARSHRPKPTVRHKLSRRPAASTSANVGSCSHCAAPRRTSSSVEVHSHLPSIFAKPAALSADSRALCGPHRRNRLRSLVRPQLLYEASRPEGCLHPPARGRGVALVYQLVPLGSPAPSGQGK